MSKPKVISIDGVDYIAKGSMEYAECGLDYVIVRGDNSGVFAGFLESRSGSEVVLKECRRLWYWEGASSISQIAYSGVSKPQNCKFPKAIAKAEVLDAIEILYGTKESFDSIAGVEEWIS